MTPQHNSIAAGRRSLRLRTAGVIGLIGIVWLAAPGGAQDVGLASATDAARLDFKVTRAASQRELITVPVNQAVMVDFSQPVTEIRVANPDIADVTATSPHQILINGKSFGTTQLIATVNGGTQKVFTLAVDLDLERLQASIRSMVPRAKVEASPLMDAVVLAGTVPDTDSAERILQVAQVYSPRVINHLQVAGVQQVLLRVTVAEVNRTATRELGFNGWIAGDNHPTAFGLSNIGSINPSNIGAAGGANATGVIPFAIDEDGISVGPGSTLSFGFPRIQMQVFVRALRENGLLRVLAEPNLVTISGEPASFLAGGEFPIPVPQDDQTITVEFREFGVRLNFTPTVLTNDKIRLQVAPEVSEPDFSNAVRIEGFVVPGLVQRRVETVVELAPGQTFAVGGLLSETARATSAKVPGLGDIPILGPLFSSVNYQSEESELVVLVTAELVSPLNPDQVVYVPGADHIAPNDWELFLLGKLDGEGRVNASEEQDALRAGQRFPVGPDELYGPPAALRLHGPIGPAYGEEGT